MATTGLIIIGLLYFGYLFVRNTIIVRMVLFGEEY